MTMKKLIVISLALILAMGAACAETLPVLPILTAEPADQEVVFWQESEEEVEIEETEEEIEPYYILPDSDIRLITEEELEGVELEMLGYMRNEILARHGYPFQKPVYQEYFRSQIWYVENPDFDYNILSEIEMANVETIKKMEAAAQ